MTANHRPLEEGDIELIDRIRGTPSLYDTRHPDFRLVYKKDQHWQSIADGLAMTHWEARKRWTVLRDRYARELKQLLVHPGSMEYGKNEFFHRMDFLRNFVKKRRVRKKSYDSQGEPLKLEHRPRPVKISKVENSDEKFQIYENLEQHEPKSYIIDDSQESSNGNYTFVDQSSQEQHHDLQQQEQLHVNHMEENVVEQDYQDYVEEASESYEAVDMEHDANTHDISNHSSMPATVNNVGLQIKQCMDSPKLDAAANFSVTTIHEPIAAVVKLPELQQKPIIQSTPSTTSTTNAPLASSSEQYDVEEYFSKTIASYLKQLSRRNKIKAKVEMMQILEKYIDIEEAEKNY